MTSEARRIAGYVIEGNITFANNTEVMTLAKALIVAEDQAAENFEALMDERAKCIAAEQERDKLSGYIEEWRSDLTKAEQENERLRDEIRALVECPVCRIKPESIAGHEHLERMRELLDG